MDNWHANRNRADGQWYCRGCKSEKSLSDFYIGSQNRPNGSCKECQKGNPKVKRRIRNRQLKQVNYTIDLYEQLSADQNGQCAICKKSPTVKGLHADHDHVTGKPRELLCVKCNSGIGFFNDDVELLERAISYIVGHRLFSSRPNFEDMIEELRVEGRGRFWR